MLDYPSSLKVAPLTSWPGEQTKARQRSPFSAPFSSTLETLDRELFQLTARTPVLEVAIEPQQFRIDGRPRAGARATHPGVVLSLPSTSVGPLRYAADRFETWQDNLRSIALGMEALRKVDRYGITRRGEQYAGFRAIESAAHAGPDVSTVDGALAFLGHAAGWSREPNLRNAADVDLAYRAAAKRLHPDAGGSTGDFQKLQQAIEVVRTWKAASDG